MSDRAEALAGTLRECRAACAALEGALEAAQQEIALMRSVLAEIAPLALASIDAALTLREPS